MQGYTQSEACVCHNYQHTRPQGGTVLSHPSHQGRILDRLWFYVNFDCNLACRYCVADSGPRPARPRIPLAAFHSLAGQGAESGFKEFVITGGEPLLHPEIKPILRYATSLLPTTILTNATLVKSRLLGKLVPTDNLTVQVSLDSSTPPFHDQARGAGSWQAAMEGILSLLAAGFRVSVRTTLNGQSPGEMSALRKLLGGLGIPAERILMAQVATGGRSTSGLQLATDDLLPEATVAADGLYMHPLKVHPAMAVARDPIPLSAALELLTAKIDATSSFGSVARPYR